MGQEIIGIEARSGSNIRTGMLDFLLARLAGQNRMDIPRPHGSCVFR